MAAAAVLIFLIAGWFLYSKPGNQKAITLVEIKTTTNTIIDTLPDASIVTLNKNTSLSYTKEFMGNTRNVSLKGEAFFNVMPNKTKPFIIQANNVIITVVGTAFNVKNYDSSTQIIVESGIVKVSYKNKIIELIKGEQITIKNNQTNFNKLNTTDSLYNYYRSHSIVCNATPLSSVIATINQAYNVNIVLKNTELNQLQLSTTFTNENIDTIINILQQTFDLRVSKEGNNYFFYTK